MRVRLPAGMCAGVLLIAVTGTAAAKTAWFPQYLFAEHFAQRAVACTSTGR